MFRNGKLEDRLEFVEQQLKELGYKQWDLRSRHKLLLDHLGLSERVIHEHRVLKKKGGPEQG